jgi:hypothetical protein
MGPVPGSQVLRKSGSAGNGTQDLCIPSQELRGTQDLWIPSQEIRLLDHRGSQYNICISIMYYII